MSMIISGIGVGWTGRDSTMAAENSPVVQLIATSCTKTHGLHLHRFLVLWASEYGAQQPDDLPSDSAPIQNATSC
jgi:hypothetical protein